MSVMEPAPSKSSIWTRNAPVKPFNKCIFFAERNLDGVLIDYHAAVTGGLCLVPDHGALAKLAADYQRMVDDGLFLDEVEPFEVLMDRCAPFSAKRRRQARPDSQRLTTAGPHQSQKPICRLCSRHVPKTTCLPRPMRLSINTSSSTRQRIGAIGSRGHMFIAIEQAHMRVETLANVVADSRSSHRRCQGALKLAKLFQFCSTGSARATHSRASQATDTVEADTERRDLDTATRFLRSTQQLMRMSS